MPQDDLTIEVWHNNQILTTRTNWKVCPRMGEYLLLKDFRMYRVIKVTHQDAEAYLTKLSGQIVRLDVIALHRVNQKPRIVHNLEDAS